VLEKVRSFAVSFALLARNTFCCFGSSGLSPAFEIEKQLSSSRARVALFVLVRDFPLPDADPLGLLLPGYPFIFIPFFFARGPHFPVSLPPDLTTISGSRSLSGRLNFFELTVLVLLDLFRSSVPWPLVL